MEMNDESGVMFIDQDLSIVWEYKYSQDDPKQQSGAGRWGSEYSSDDRNRTSFHTLSGVQDERDVQVPEEEEVPVFSMENRHNRKLRELRESENFRNPNSSEIHKFL